MVPSRTVWLFANETEAASKVTAPLNRGEVESIDVHGVCISGWMWHMRAIVLHGLRNPIPSSTHSSVVRGRLEFLRLLEG